MHVKSWPAAAKTLAMSFRQCQNERSACAAVFSPIRSPVCESTVRLFDRLPVRPSARPSVYPSARPSTQRSSDAIQRARRSSADRGVSSHPRRTLRRYLHQFARRTSRLSSHRQTRLRPRTRVHHADDEATDAAQFDDVRRRRILMRCSTS